jgi:hypothetical protein
MFHNLFYQGMIRFPKDIMLYVNSFYALSGLAYNNKNNCNLIIATDILDLSKKLLLEYPHES